MTTAVYLEDAYLRLVYAKVLRCDPVDDGSFAVVLDRTVLYPEGGGQPSDGGRMDDRQVLRLRQDGDDVIHLLDGPVEGQVKVYLDWDRRYDHMQQHTAQHLLTAVAQDRLDLATTAFHLGPERSDIELDCPALSPGQLAELEQACNTHVREALEVTTVMVKPEDLDGLEVRTRGLPEGHTGEVRLVCIEGVDTNTCGGTHVANTAELQAIKLLQTERLRGGTRLFYVSGHRVLRWIDRAQAHQRALGEALSCGPEDHPASVQRLLDDARAHRRQQKAAREELADLWAQAQAGQPGVACLHRPDGDMAFLRAAGGALQRQDPHRWALLTAGEGQGVFMVLGPEEPLKTQGPRVAALLEGKGGGARGIFQGKAQDLSRREEALALLEA